MENDLLYFDYNFESKETHRQNIPFFREGCCSELLVSIHLRALFLTLLPDDFTQLLQRKCL